MKLYLILINLTFCTLLLGQGTTKRVLFIGNSYTYVNDLPQMLANIANYAGDTVIYDSNTPGGYTLSQHYFNATTISKIKQGNWDYVVLQEQSQYPSFPIGQVEAEVFPYAYLLDSIINLNNPCAETIFYMTWGRKNGDQGNCPSWPPVCTYKGMDSLLRLRYEIMAKNNNAILSPVGAVWREIINNSSIELYQPDQSHPSYAGTYAAACSFYTTIYRKNPMLITFNPGISPTDVNIIKAATKKIIYDTMSQWHIGSYDTKADFSYNSNANTYSFINNSKHATKYLWYFGDNDTSQAQNPSHTYTKVGKYTITLIASKCNKYDTFSLNITIAPNSVKSINLPIAKIYPNPANTYFQIEIKQPLNDIKFSITNMEGKVIAVPIELINETNYKLNTSALPSGIYYINILTDKGSYQQKLLIIK